MEDMAWVLYALLGTQIFLVLLSAWRRDALVGVEKAIKAQQATLDAAIDQLRAIHDELRTLRHDELRTIADAAEQRKPLVLKAIKDAKEK